MLKRGWWIAIACAVLAGETTVWTTEARDAPVAVFVKPDEGAPHEVGRPSMEATGGVQKKGALPSRKDVRTAAVAVSLGRLAGWHVTEGTLGVWHAEGALQEGGLPWRETIPGPRDERRASEIRLRGANFLGRGRAILSTASRNYDPASGVLLTNGARLIGSDSTVEGASRYELGYDLVRRMRIRGARMLNLDMAASRERKDAPVPWPGVLSSLTHPPGSVLADADVPAVALLGADDPAGPGAVPLPGVPAARTRIDSLRINARLFPRSAMEGDPPRARTRFTVGLQKRRQFAAVCCRLGGGPRAVPGRSNTSHFVATEWNRAGLGFTYRFSLLTPEDLPGPHTAMGPRVFEHQLNGTMSLSDALRLRLRLARIETSNERFARDFAATRSALGLDWTFLPRWTASGDFRALESTGPGSAAGLRLWAVDGRLARSIVLPRSRIGADLFTRSWFQNEPGRFQHEPGRIVSRTSQDQWALEAGIRVPF